MLRVRSLKSLSVIATALCQPTDPVLVAAAIHVFLELFAAFVPRLPSVFTFLS